jgi:Lipid A 3-O-deacylase (PagL)
MRSSWIRFVCVVAALVAHGAHADGLSSFCADCQLQLGIGGTYHYWGRTGGIVIPLTLDWDQDRYEIGAFRMATRQHFFNPRFRVDELLAEPYWGFSASRRWELLRKTTHWRLLLGFGGSYKTETNDLSASHWNFAEQLGVRFLPTGNTAIELCGRHWSNAGLKTPNRGQDFATLTFTFWPGRKAR